MDIYQSADQELVLRAELPGIAPEDIELNVNNDTLTISGEKRLSNEVKEAQYHRIERQYGTFSRVGAKIFVASTDEGSENDVTAKPGSNA